jgi:hypothetical protein
MSFSSSSALRVNTKDTATLLGDDKFCALEELVRILPKFSSDQAVDCIKGKFGPFRANSEAKVPLWAALEMDRLQQCTIMPPAWMHEEELKRMRDEEVADKERFLPVPEHYVEIALALLTRSRVFSDEQRQKTRTMLLLRELIEIRRNKIITGMKEFDTHPTEMNVTNMSAAELTCFRTRSCYVLDKFLDLLRSKKVAEKEEFQPEEEDGADMQEDSSSRPNF